MTIDAWLAKEFPDGKVGGLMASLCTRAFEAGTAEGREQAAKIADYLADRCKAGLEAEHVGPIARHIANLIRTGT